MKVVDHVSVRPAESGLLHKVVLFAWGAQVIEEIQVFTQAQPIKSMLLSSTKVKLTPA